MLMLTQIQSDIVLILLSLSVVSFSFTTITRLLTSKFSSVVNGKLRKLTIISPPSVLRFSPEFVESPHLPPLLSITTGFATIGRGPHVSRPLRALQWGRRSLGDLSRELSSHCGAVAHWYGGQSLSSEDRRLRPMTLPRRGHAIPDSNE